MESSQGIKHLNLLYRNDSFNSKQVQTRTSAKYN